MKLYRRHIKTTAKIKMHLVVDHYLEPFNITEDDMWDIMDEHSRNSEHESNFLLQEDFAIIAKAIYDKITGS